MKNTCIVFLLLISTILSGCLLGRILIGVGSRRAATVALTEGALVSAGEARLISMFRAARITRAGSVITVGSPANFYSNLSQLRLMRSVSGRPQLALKDASQPFAEILTGRGRVRILDSGEQFYIKRNIFSVNKNVVNVRSGPLETSSNKIGQLYYQDMVVVLKEFRGWYYIEFLKNGLVTNGWVSTLLLLPLVEKYQTVNDESEVNLLKCNSCKGIGTVRENVKCNQCLTGYFDCYKCNAEGTLPCELCGKVGHTDCNNCSGKGDLSCNPCNGWGKLPCNFCQSIGNSECNFCSGRGQVIDYRGNKQKCNSCRGMGKLQCNSCRGSGNTQCLTCRGSQKSKCMICLGSGKIQCKSCLSQGFYKCMVCLSTGKLACNYCHGKRFELMDIECANCYGYGKVEVDN